MSIVGGAGDDLREADVDEETVRCWVDGVREDVDKDVDDDVEDADAEAEEDEEAVEEEDELEGVLNSTGGIFIRKTKKRRDSFNKT